MEKKSKILIASSIMAAVAVAGVAIGTTTALFTKKVEENVHIQAGELKVGFYLKQLFRDEFKEDGTFEETEVDIETLYGHYTEGKGVNLAEYQGGFSLDKFYPTMRARFVFLVDNAEDDIAINLKMETTKKGKFANDTDMTDGTGGTEDQTAALVEKEKPWETDTFVAKGASSEGTYVIELDKELADDDYQKCSFDINVLLKATQFYVERS